MTEQASLPCCASSAGQASLFGLFRFKSLHEDKTLSHETNASLQLTHRGRVCTREFHGCAAGLRLNGAFSPHLKEKLAWLCRACRPFPGTRV